MDLQGIVDEIRQRTQEVVESVDRLFYENRIPKIAALLAVAILLLSGAYLLLSQSPQEKVLKIVDRYKKPVSGATVSVYSGNGSLIASRQSDSNGNLRLEKDQLDWADRFLISKEGFQNASFRLYEAGSTEIELTATKDANVPQIPGNATPAAPASPAASNPSTNPSTSPGGTDGEATSPTPDASNAANGSPSPIHPINANASQTPTPFPTSNPSRQTPSPTPSPISFGPSTEYEVCRNQAKVFNNFRYALIDATATAAAFEVTQDGNALCAGRTPPCLYQVKESSLDNEGLEKATKVRIGLLSVNATSVCAKIAVSLGA